METITFLLPGTAQVPIGGFKVVFEYANRLVEEGYKVNLILPTKAGIKGSYIRSALSLVKRLILNNYKPYCWFDLDKRVKLKLVVSLDQCFVPKSDVYIATAVDTAVYLNKYKIGDSSKKFYFIQAFEDWTLPKEVCFETYRYDMSKITISPFLQNLIASQGEDSVLVENGFNFDYFTLSVPIKEKDKFKATMLYHALKHKASDEGIKAVEIVRQKYPQFRLNMFGFPDKPAGLPDWIEYYQIPSQEVHNRIYNEAAFFIGPSHSEGFCLTPPEAMMCGCAVVCTDIGGYTVICKDGFNAITNEVENVEQMAQNIIKLIEDDELRFAIAQNGNDKVKEYTWQRAYDKFKATICGHS